MLQYKDVSLILKPKLQLMIIIFAFYPFVIHLLFLLHKIYYLHLTKQVLHGRNYLFLLLLFFCIFTFNILKNLNYYLTVLYE